MKKVNLIISAVLLAFLFSSCEKCEEECDLVAAKVIRYDCDRVIIQMLTSDIIGDSNWEDVQTGQRYSNVVSYYNTCKIQKLTKGKKIKIYVELKELTGDAKNRDCVQCEAVSQNPPQTVVDFAKISKEGCGIQF